MQLDRLLGVSRWGQHHLCYGTDGIGRGWMPASVQRRIVRWWNRWACRRWGHDWAPIDLTWGRAPRLLVTVGCTACPKRLGRMWVASPFA